MGSWVQSVWRRCGGPHGPSAVRLEGWAQGLPSRPPPPPASGGRKIPVGWVGLVEDGGGAEVVVLVEVGVGVEEVEDGARGRRVVGHPAVEEPEVVQHRRAWGGGGREDSDVNPLPRIAFAQTSFPEPLETTARHSTQPENDENDRPAKGTRPF